MPDDDKTDVQVAMLGAPLSTSEHLYPDLQSLYRKTNWTILWLLYDNGIIDYNYWMSDIVG